MVVVIDAIVEQKHYNKNLRWAHDVNRDISMILEINDCFMISDGYQIESSRKIFNLILFTPNQKTIWKRNGKYMQRKNKTFPAICCIGTLSYKLARRFDYKILHDNDKLTQRLTTAIFGLE